MFLSIYISISRVRRLNPCAYNRSGLKHISLCYNFSSTFIFTKIVLPALFYPYTVLSLFDG